MGIRYDVVMTLPPSGNGQRTRLALQQGDDGIVRPAVLRMLMEGVTPFTAAAGGDVLSLLDVIELDGGRWGVFELVPGATLRELIEVHAVARRLPALGLSARVVVDAAKAMGVLHRQATPIAHGGLSDAALLVGFDGVTSVLDLGAPRSSRMMAPEQVRGSPATPATDVFCLGAALHSALTGYDGPYASAVAAGLDTLPWTYGSAEGSQALDQVLREALHPAPNMRWPDAGSFAEQLESIVFQQLIGKDALATVIKTLFKDRQAVLRDAVEQSRRSAGAPGPRPSREQARPRSSRELPLVSAVVEAAPPAVPPPPPRSSRDSVPPPRASVRTKADAPRAERDADGEGKTVIRASRTDLPTQAAGTAPAGDNPPTMSLRGPRPSEPPAPRASLSRPPRASPSKAPQVVKIEEDPPALGEADEAPTGADHGAIVDESDLSHVPAPPELEAGTDFDPGATTPGHKLKVPVPKDFAPDATPYDARRPSTGIQVKMQSEEEKAAAAGQEKISTADLDPDERDDGLGGELGEPIDDQPTNVRPRPKLTSDSMDALPVEPGVDDVEGDPTAPPKRMPKVEESADLEAAGIKKKKGGGARAVIALLLLAIAGGSGYVVLMRPDLMVKVKARIAQLKGQKPAPVPEEQPPTDALAELDGGLALDADGGEAPVVAPPPAVEADAGAPTDAGAVAEADAGQEADDGGSDDGGVDDDDDAAPPPTKDAGPAKDVKKTKKVKKKRRR